MGIVLDQEAVMSELDRSFNQDNMVLFAGLDWEKELSEAVCNLPWSCVVTTSRESSFAARFEAAEWGRSVFQNTEEKNPEPLFDRRRLPIIHLFGTDSEIDTELSEDELEELREEREYIARNKLDRIFARADVRTRIVVMGLKPDCEEEIEEKHFVHSMRGISGGNIVFFMPGDSGEAFGKLKSKAEEADFTWCPFSISAAKDEEFGETNASTFRALSDLEGNNVFYKGGEAILVRKNLLNRSSNFASLLTKESVYSTPPFGRVRRERWFYNFLNNTSRGPQWYGYYPQSTFYLKRDYEDLLLAAVLNLLEGHNLTVRDLNTPIILEGAPGSSKSVELGAIAYKIFEMKNNPVIYIHNDDLNLDRQSSEMQELENLIQEIDRLGEKDVRILVIWDSSAYRDVASEAKRLSHFFQNIGKRCVLLCSSYAIPRTKMAASSANGGDSFESAYYEFGTDHTFRRVSAEDDRYLEYYNGLYYVKASREMRTDREIVAFKQQAREYRTVDSDIFKSRMAELENSRDIFECYYSMLISLQPDLDTGLKREQNVIAPFIRRQMAMVTGREVEEDNPMVLALRKAGIALSDEQLQSIRDDEQRASEKFDEIRFAAAIAMFSQFKLGTPYSLALGMLCKDGFRFGRDSEYNNRELFHFLTTQISFIKYKVPDNGTPVFYFRNSIEAERFLERNDYAEPDKQLELLLHMLDFYIDDYKENGEVDPALKDALTSLLRMYGPNTEYLGFKAGGNRKIFHDKVLAIYDRIIGKMAQIRSVHRIPDEDSRFSSAEITFTREIYGKLWKVKPSGGETPQQLCEEYDLRLKKLEDVMILAGECIQNLENLKRDSRERQSLQHNINMLCVERTYIDLAIEDIWSEYVLLEEKPIELINVKPLPFKSHFDALSRSIAAEPLNGYNYIALFKRFIDEYERSGEEMRVKLLSDIMLLVDDACTLDIPNRGMDGRDELGELSAKIMNFSNSYDIRIADIVGEKTSERGQSRFMEMFEHMLNQNSATFLCFVCQKELEALKLDSKSLAEKERRFGDEEAELTRDQLEACDYILKFMTDEKYIDCIERSTQAMYLLLRVQWMRYNGRPLSVRKEWKKTYIRSEREWLAISETCRKYAALEQENGAMVVRPIVHLIHAIAQIQLKNDYRSATREMFALNEDMPANRMWVPYLICDVSENGESVPRVFTGRMGKSEVTKGTMIIDGVNDKNDGIVVKAYIRNLGIRRMPEKDQRITGGVELGLCFTGSLSAHRSRNGGAES